MASVYRLDEREMKFLKLSSKSSVTRNIYALDNDRSSNFRQTKYASIFTNQLFVTSFN